VKIRITIPLTFSKRNYIQSLKVRVTKVLLYLIDKKIKFVKNYTLNVNYNI